MEPLTLFSVNQYHFYFKAMVQPTSGESKDIDK